MQHHLATIINFCTNDYLFIKKTINQARKFSQLIIVPYCDHFYDGSPENNQLLTQTIQQNPFAKFIKFQYQPQATHNLWRGWQFFLRPFSKTKVWGPQYWICYARLFGFHHIPQNIKYVLFLDADEIPDGHRFKAWLDTKDYLNYQAIKPANYWYWRTPTYQATIFENSSLLANKTALETAVFMDHDERNATFKSIKGLKKKMQMGIDNQPLIHHYGWAKPQKNLLKKVKTWGHSKDRNWTKLIKKEFSHPFTGTDFIYHRHFKTVKPFFSFN